MKKHHWSECQTCGEPIGLIGRAFQWLLGRYGWHRCKKVVYQRPLPLLLTGEALERERAGFEKQALENYEVSRDIQIRDDVDRRGRKIKGKRL